MKELDNLGIESGSSYSNLGGNLKRKTDYDGIINGDNYIVFNSHQIQVIDTIIKEHVKSFEVFIKEGKQVGFLYHWTTPSNLEKILNTNTLKGGYINIKGKESVAISTTRNKNFKYDKRKVQIVLDGDKISNKYKITPYDYWQRDYNVPQNPQTIDEDEEIIHVNEIPNIADYILGINIGK